MDTATPKRKSPFSSATTLCVLVAAILYVAFGVWDFIRIDATSHSASDTLRPFIIQMFALGVVLCALCREVRRRIASTHSR